MLLYSYPYIGLFLNSFVVLFEESCIGGGSDVVFPITPL